MLIILEYCREGIHYFCIFCVLSGVTTKGSTWPKPGALGKELLRGAPG